MAGVLGNAGQGDYAAANAYMDGYMHQRAQAVAAGEGHGVSMSIAWPLWQDGGMTVHEAQHTFMSHFGLSTLSTTSALENFYQCLATKELNLLVLSGDRQRFETRFPALQVVYEQSTVHPERTTRELQPSSLLQKNHIDSAEAVKLLVQSTLVEGIQELLKLPREHVQLFTELSEFGFDSISLTAFSNLINEKLRLDTTPAMFFEYTSVDELSDYIISNFSDHLISQVETPVQLKVSPVARVAVEPALSTLMPVKKNDQVDQVIAIIGMSGSFAQAKNMTDFWQNLSQGKDCISLIPERCWPWQSVYGDPLTEVNKTNVKWAATLPDTDMFDPLFFGLSPHEALLMDPQQRMILKHTWLAIEDAGYAPSSLKGSNTSVFIGTASSGYNDLISQRKTPVEGYSSTGAANSVGPNRVSFMLDLHGPSEPVDTACSSSLVALHRAVHSIRHEGCEMAISGGVNTLVSLNRHISFNKAGMLAKDGRCKTFSQSADGYGRGEGVVIFLLKPLHQAQLDNDSIYGLILGSAVNHGGKANSFTAPNVSAQAQVIEAAYQNAQIDPRSVTYIEAHGTGTKIGDPVEINALKMAFKALYAAPCKSEVSPDSTPTCAIGAVKSNIGHTELSAGAAGVAKILLQMQHKTLVKSLHCEQVNKYIEFANSPFYILQQKKPWEAALDSDGQPLPLRAGVSSFGFGGVNAHIVLSQYCAPVPVLNPEHNTAWPVVISAKTSSALVQQIANLKAYLENEYDQINMCDLAYTLQVGREQMNYRVAFMASTVQQVIEALQLTHNGTITLYQGHYDVQRTRGDYQSETNQRSQAQLIELWATGKLCEIDWQTLYQQNKLVVGKRIRLPGYCFEEQSYWIPKGLEDTAPKSALNRLTSFTSQWQLAKSYTPDAELPEQVQVWGCELSMYTQNALQGALPMMKVLNSSQREEAHRYEGYVS
ncbi:beta-ketoacyl synthase N-terminal-like domain-containing protein, partial [Pseudoalteromonas holothuriae]|uniref:beta-ketoacyl synthase N-terminal-like domain-containing protein n=1 Tax=Pseudoalteromonas holothuriae TaxID=2963714 RepID=UPI0021C1A2CE